MKELFRVATLPGNLEFDNLEKKTGKTRNVGKFWKKPGKTWNFKQKSLKKPGLLTIFTCSVVKFQIESKIKNFCHHQKYFSLKYI